MTKRKKSHHHKTTRRRSVGGIHKKGLMNDVVEAVGFVVGHIGGGMLQKNFSALNPKIVSAGELVGGFWLKHKSKSPFMQGLSYGIIGAGAVGIAHEFHVIAGIDNFINGISNEDGGMRDFQRQLEQEKQSGINNDMYMHGIDNAYGLGGANVGMVG